MWGKEGKGEEEEGEFGIGEYRYKKRYQGVPSEALNSKQNLTKNSMLVILFSLAMPTAETCYRVLVYHTSRVGRVWRKGHLHLQFCSSTLKADI